jgi:hypothetical protein
MQMDIFMRITAISIIVCVPKSSFCISSAAFGPWVSTCADYYAKLAEIEQQLQEGYQGIDMEALEGVQDLFG